MRIIESLRKKIDALRTNKEKPQPTEKQPLVFVNQPINDSDHDIVGFSAQVDTICEAISHGSTMICIAADYGTGKSSLTKLLSHSVTRKPLCYPAPIKINMWDCLLESKNNGGESRAAGQEVSELTRSFLYQLSSGNEKNHHFSSYINKRLSRNYGNISLSTGSFKFWWCFGFAALFYTAYNVCSNSKVKFDRVVQQEWLLNALKIGQAFNPVLLSIAGIFLVWGIIHTCIVFSHWKTQNARETEVNDVFDVYAQVIDHIKPKRKKKQLIIVEDLDRIVEKSVIIGFLKELYRFQSSMQRYADQFVFVVSIKPEAVLTDQGQQMKFDDDHVYSKLFDLIVPLKPIHYDDYDSILLELFKRDPDAKKRLEALTGETIDSNILPKSFDWIKRGNNLTLRDLKDRLNHAVMIMLMTAQRHYQVKTAVTFEACAAVTYLESQYPSDYHKLIQSEKAFARLMSNSVGIINSNDGTAEIMQELENDFQRQFSSTPFNADFISDICTLICNGVFNYDFRMYFYTYPSGSHIKTTEERELCDMLLMPTKFHDYSSLGRITDAVYTVGGTNENNIVTAIIAGLEAYPEVVLMDKTLLRIACEHNWREAAAAANRYMIKPMALDEYAVNFWTRVHDVEFSDKNSFVKNLITYLIASFSIPEDIVLTRGYIIRAYGKDILTFKQLFFKSSAKIIPQISAEELSLIEDVSVAIELIDPDNLTADNFGYISELLCREPLSEATLDRALGIIYRYYSVEPEGYGTVALQFLDTNHYIDSTLFKSACGNCDANVLLKYLNALDPDQFPDAYYDDIEARGFTCGLSFDILVCLAARKYYRCILLAASASKDFTFLDNSLGDAKNILEDCVWLCENDIQSFISIRWHLCVELGDQRYFDLYFAPFPLITEGEYISFSNTFDAIRCVDAAAINEDNYMDVLGFLHKRSYDYDEVMFLIRQLFDPERYSRPDAFDKKLLGEIVNDMDYSIIQIRQLSCEDRETVYAFMRPAFVTLKLANDKCLRQLNCLIPSVEKALVADDDSCYEELVRDLDEFTPYTLKWMSENYITIALSEKLSLALKENNDFENYITSSVLREQNMIIDETIPREKYRNVYIHVGEMYTIMSDHWDFLEGLQNKESLQELLKAKNSDDLITPIYKVPQHSEFFTFMLTGKFPVATKTAYLDAMGKFASEQDSRNFQLLICKPEHIELVGNHKRYWKLWNNFWLPTHKSQFTRAWNKRWDTELGSPM